MTSLKVKYADEIIEAMANTLNDENFTDMFINKQAAIKTAGMALESYKKDLAQVSDENGLNAIWTKHLPLLEKEENTIEGTIQAATCARAEKAQQLGIPGYQIPCLHSF